MIYESHSKQLPHPKPEDFTYPDRGFDARAYEATQIYTEIQNASYDGVWKDEETGKVLFTVSVEFVPDANYYANGQGTEVRTYQAHFELKEGQTAEEAFYERQKIDNEKNLFKQALQNLSPESKAKLDKQIEEVTQQSNEALRQEIRQLQERAILNERNKELRKKALISREKREKDPLWMAIRDSAQVLIKDHRKKEAAFLIRSYLEQHTRVN